VNTTKNTNHDRSNILLVTDQQSDMISKLTDLLQQHKFELAIYSDGNEAFNAILAAPNYFDAVILGKKIANMESIHLLHMISTCSEASILPIIMEVDINCQTEIVNLIQAGARYCLPSEFDQQLALELVKAAVRDHHRYLEEENSTAAHLHLADNLEYGLFKISTLEESHILANFIAESCPNPKLAIVGITEMFINAIEHGNLKISYEEKTKLYKSSNWLKEISRRLELAENKNKLVQVEYKRSVDRVKIFIKDEGEGFDWKKYTDVHQGRLFDNHGRGIAMAKALAFSKIEYFGKGNEVECTILLDE